MKRLLSQLMVAAVFFTTATLVTAVIDTPEAQAQKRRTTKKSSTRAYLGVRGGYVLWGQGEADLGGVSAELEDHSQFALNVFGLIPVAPRIRVGLSVWGLPTVDFQSPEATTEDEEDDGFELDLNLYGEYTLVFGGVLGYVFADAGYTILFPNQDEEATTEAENWTGFNAGAGLGVKYSVSRGLRLRAEGRGQYYQLTAPGTGDIADTDFTGQRIMLNVGADFSL